MTLREARISQTVRDRAGHLWKVVSIDENGECGRGYTVIIEEIHTAIRITAHRDETMAEFTPLRNPA